MRRRLFAILSAVSLLLFAGTALLWVRSYLVLDDVGYVGRRSVSSLASAKGCVWAGWYTGSDENPAEDRGWQPRLSQSADEWPTAAQFRAGFPVQCTERAGVLWGTASGGRGVWCVILRLSDGYPLGAFVIVPLSWCWRRWRTGLRRRHGRCLVCGYDLRSTPDRCPECGTTPACEPDRAAPRLRRLLTCLSLLSVVGCAACAAVWVRSYWAYDVVEHAVDPDWDVDVVEHAVSPGFSTDLISISGRLVLWHVSNDNILQTTVLKWAISSATPSSDTGSLMRKRFVFDQGSWWNRMGFAALSDREVGSGKFLVIVAAPHWSFVAALSLLSGVLWLSRRQLSAIKHMRDSQACHRLRLRRPRLCSGRKSQARTPVLRGSLAPLPAPGYNRRFLARAASQGRAGYGRTNA